MATPTGLEITIGVIEDLVAVIFIFLITLYVSVFTHSSSNFYTRISALMLASGLFFRILLLATDSCYRYMGANIMSQPWYFSHQDTMNTFLVYDPLLIFTIPIFAVICDWTEARVLLDNNAEVTAEVYQKKKRMIKNVFLCVSITTIVAMWIDQGSLILDDF